MNTTKENLMCDTCNKEITGLSVAFGKNGTNHISCLDTKLRGEISPKKKRNYRV